MLELCTNASILRYVAGLENGAMTGGFGAGPDDDRNDDCTCGDDLGHA